MSIDIIIQGSTKAALKTFAETLKLIEDDGQGGKVNRPGFHWSWWAGTGNFLTALGTYDQSGNELVAPTYAPGFVALLKITADFFIEQTDGEGIVTRDYDRLNIDQDDPDKDEQWAKSRIVRYIKNNGTPGNTGSIAWYQLDNVKLYKPVDVEAWLQSNGLPTHSWQGGNSY